MKPGSFLLSTIFSLFAILLFSLLSCGYKGQQSNTFDAIAPDLNLQDTVFPTVATRYINNYDSLYKIQYPLFNGQYITNSGVSSFSIPLSYITFFTKLANQNQLFKGQNKVIWAVLALDTVFSNSNQFQLKLFVVAQNSQTTNYYDVSTLYPNGQPKWVEPSIAMQRISNYQAYQKNVNAQRFSITDTTAFCTLNVSGFEVNYTDLSQLATYNIDGNLNAVLALRPCSPNQSIFDLFIQCQINPTSNSNKLANVDGNEVEAYFDFTLPCPNNCPW